MKIAPVRAARPIRAIERAMKGFTLIELMATVLIIAILAAIAIPIYQKYVIETNRKAAMTDLQACAQAMERYYAQNNTYTGATLGTTTGSLYPSTSPQNGAARYTLSISNLTDNSYTLNATPIGGTIQESDGAIHLDSSGLQTWDRNNDGTIGTDENTWK